MPRWSPRGTNLEWARRIGAVGLPILSADNLADAAKDCESGQEPDPGGLVNRTPRSSARLHCSQGPSIPSRRRLRHQMVGGVTPAKAAPPTPTAGGRHRRRSRGQDRRHRLRHLWPPPFAADAIVEAVDAGLELAVSSPKGFRSSTSQGEARPRRVAPRWSGRTARVSSRRRVQIGIMPGHIPSAARLYCFPFGTLTYGQLPRPRPRPRPTPASASAATRSTAPLR